LLRIIEAPFIHPHRPFEAQQRPIVKARIKRIRAMETINPREGIRAWRNRRLAWGI